MVSKKHRNTVQKDAIFNILRSEPDFMSSPTLHSKLQSAGLKVGMADGVSPAWSPGFRRQGGYYPFNGEQLYRLCAMKGMGAGPSASPSPSHGLGENCGKPLRSSRRTSSGSKPAAEHGFSVTYHMFEIIGCALNAGASWVLNNRG